MDKLIIKKGEGKGIIEKTSYQAFFTIGVSFLALGIILTSLVNPGFIGFIALGIIYMAIGLTNRDKLKKSE